MPDTISDKLSDDHGSEYLPSSEEGAAREYIPDADEPVPEPPQPVVDPLEGAPEWASGQMVDAKKMTSALKYPVDSLVNPPFFRADMMQNSKITGDPQVVVWRYVDIRGWGFSTNDHIHFRTEVSGLYWVNCQVSAQTPFTKPPGWAATLILQVHRNPWHRLDSVLKAFKSTTLVSGWDSVSTSGLVTLGEGHTLHATVRGWGGLWTTAQTELGPSISVFSAVLLAPNVANM